MKKLTLALLGLVLTGCATTRRPLPDADLRYTSGVRIAGGGAAIGRCQAPESLKGADWRTLVQAASQCVSEKRWPLVEALAFEMSRRDLANPWAPYFVSLSAENAREYPRAMWMIDLALKKSSQEIALFRFQKGRLWFLQQQVVKAMLEFEAAVKQDPALVEANLFLAEVHFRDAETDQASSYFKQALFQDETNLRALRGLAECQIRNGKAPIAAELLARAATAHPRDLMARVRLGYVWEEMLRDQTKALSVFQELRASLENGTVQGKPDFDLNMKIKLLQNSMASGAPKPGAREVSSERSAR